MISRPMGRRLLPVLLLLAVLIPAATANAEPKWLDPATLSGDGTASQTATAFSGPGEAFAAWVKDNQIEVAQRPPGGAWGTPQTLGGGSQPSLAGADDGTVVLVWAADDGVHVSLRGPAGQFSPPATLADGGTGAPSDVRVEMNGRADAVVSWARNLGGAVKAVVDYRPAGQDFSGAQAVSAGNVCTPRSAIGVTGNAAVVWNEGSCGLTGPVKVSRRTGDSGVQFGAAEDVGEAGREAVTAVSDDGKTLVVWSRGTDIRQAAAPVGAGFTAPTTVSDPADGVVNTPQAGISADGTSIIAWVAGASGAQRPVITAAARNVAFPAGRDLTSKGDPTTNFHLAVGSGGAATAVWVRGTKVEGAQRRADNSLTPPTSLTDANASDPSVASDSVGDGLAGYVIGNRATGKGFDGGGPILSNVAYPGVAEQTVPLALGATATDVWSAVASQSWDFGDGTTGAGATIAHAYTVTGVVTYQALATDTLGNVSSFARQLYVFPKRDLTAPVISGFTMDRKTFKVSNKKTALTADLHKSKKKTKIVSGSRFRYSVSEPCKALIYLELKKGKKYQPVGILIRDHPIAGKVSVGFTGRIAGDTSAASLADQTLVPGQYRATIQAADKAGNKSKKHSLTFRIAK